MSQPGFYDSTIVFNSTTTSTTYVGSTIVPFSQKNKYCVYISCGLGAGLTSAEFKFQQCLTNDANGEWFDYPIVNYSTLTTSSDTPPEYYLTSKAFTQSLTSAAGQTQKLGPYEITVGMPFFRVAYKVTGGGTLTSKIIVTRILL